MDDALICNEGLRSPRNAAKTATHRSNRVLQRYKMISKVGEGTYGVVRKAQDTEDPDLTLVAVKKIWLDDRDEGVPVTTLREVRTAASRP